MPDDLIVRHCAPTVAGLKTGNMFMASFADEKELAGEVRRLNKLLAAKGLRVTVLRISETCAYRSFCADSRSAGAGRHNADAGRHNADAGRHNADAGRHNADANHCHAGCRALIYIYRPGQLQNDLDREEAREILGRFGYEMCGHEMCIKRLCERIGQCSEFPHEVGLFLGYPPEDVKGFIEEGSRKCKACGYWKVYGDVDTAQKRFAQFSKCTGVYLKCLERGLPFEKLAVRKKVSRQDATA